MTRDKVVEISSTAATINTDFNLTDAGNVERFFARHGVRLRYCPAMSMWFLWTGVVWQADEQREVWGLALDTVRSLYHEAGDAGTREDRVRITDFAKKCEGRRALEALVTMAGNLAAEYGAGVAPSDFDADPWTLNSASGLLNLKTQELQSHRPREWMFSTDTRAGLCSKLAGAPYVEGASSPLWDDFLLRVLPDPDVRAFVQRAVGSALVGEQREERLFFIHGPSATGKSTFIRAIQAALGTYATVADFETFLARPGQAGGAREDLARLAGRRLVVSLEVDEGRRLAVGVVKALTGGDEVAARYLYGRTFTFIPRFSLWLVANVRPGVPAEDDAVWRRIVEIPFTTVIPEAERNPDLKTRLCDPTECGPAVLFWLVCGARAWLQEGLRIPAAVRMATDAYRDEVDSIGAFLADGTEQQPQLRAPAGDLYTAYRKHAEATGERPLSARRFKARLEGRGLRQRKTGSGLVWEGLAVLHDADINE